MFSSTPLSLRTLYIQSFLTALNAPFISISTTTFQLSISLSFFTSASILRIMLVVDLPGMPPAYPYLNQPSTSLVVLSHPTTALLTPLLTIDSSDTGLYPFTILMSLPCLGISISSTSFMLALSTRRSLFTSLVTFPQSSLSISSTFIMILSFLGALNAILTIAFFTYSLVRSSYLHFFLLLADLVLILASSSSLSGFLGLSRASVITVTYSFSLLFL